MGTTALFYSESHVTDVIPSKIDRTKLKTPTVKLEVRRIILSEVIKQMSGFQSLLDNALTESKTFDVYDANQVVWNWKNTNPKLLDTFYKTTSIQLSLNESASKGESTASVVISSPNTTSGPKFVLLGWVDGIYERETRTPIPGTGKVSFLYSLEISCEYRLINPDKNRVIAAFVAIGHGGIARIISPGNLPGNYDIKLITNDVFNSLAQDLRHILLVREDEYIKKKINAKKINVSMPMPTK